MMRFTVRLLCVSLAAFLPAAAAFAQGRVVGTIRNQDGQAVKGATITATSPDATPSTVTSTTDGKGRFSFLGLRRGEYTFTIEAPGYVASRTRAAIRGLGNNPPLDIVLRAVRDLPPGGPLAGVDVEALQQRLDEAAAREKAGRIDEAIGLYREIAARYPALTMVHLQLGVLLERKQDAAGATAEYQAALASDPSNAKARAALERLSRQ